MSICWNVLYKSVLIGIVSIPILTVYAFSILSQAKHLEPEINITHNNTFVTLAFVGDIMAHSPIIRSSYDTNHKSYDFSPIFSHIQSDLQSYDFLIGNLETPVAGIERGFSGYPNFNAPTEMLSTLSQSGFDILAFANNHSMDQGLQGITHTVQEIKKHTMLPIGATNTTSEYYTPTIVYKNGIRIAFINASYGLNGYTLSEKNTYRINIINTKKLISAIQNARELSADIVIVYLHFGNEYEKTANKQQVQLAHTLANAGVDAIIGSHPHVVQNVEYYAVGKKIVPILYSLGNFLSNQQDIHTDIGMIYKLRIYKDTTQMQDAQDYIVTSKKIEKNSYKYKLDFWSTLLSKTDVKNISDRYKLYKSRYIPKDFRSINSLSN